MAGNKERSNIEKKYLVQKQLGGIQVVDQTTGNQFFRAKSGGWFWLMGLDNPFDEDVQLGNQEKEYLDSIVSAAGFNLNDSQKEK